MALRILKDAVLQVKHEEALLESVFMHVGVL